MSSGRSLRVGEALLGGVLVALGLFIVAETMMMPGADRGVVGPALFPYMIAGGLILIGLSLLREAVTGRIAHAGGLELDWKAVALVAGALVVEFLVIEYLGWIPAATLLFVATSRGFGSRRPLVDAAIGLALTGATFVIFDYGLDLNLPAGELIEQFTADEEAM